ncbi:MAG: response regulator transcription factor [Clostridiaceae bacterium]|nr:response regulator transcription factor [Clostridiaceae bacterium]
MIYIVEDDVNIRQMEAYALQSSGYETAECESSAQLWKLCRDRPPELVILDLMLPGEDGMEILKRLREQYPSAQIPAIIVSAKSTEMDRVRGLDSGADDYIVKPFGVMELISRVRAVLRRSDGAPTKRLTLGNIMLDDERRQVFADGRLCRLTYKEHELLRTLILNRDVVLSRDKLMDLVWGTEYAGESRTVDMHIMSLRQKLGESGDRIKTVRNVGYKAESL